MYIHYVRFAFKRVVQISETITLLVRAAELHGDTLTRILGASFPAPKSKGIK